MKTVYRLYEEKTHALLTDKLTFIFLELNKFKKGLEELDGNVLEGMYFCLKNMARLDGCPEVLTHEVFRKMFHISELLNMDEDTRSKVLIKMTTERDLRNQMAYARKEAIEEGLAEGRAQGQKEKSIEIARKLLAAGYPEDEVLDLTGVKVDEL